jgi:hypothetical protein
LKTRIGALPMYQANVIVTHRKPFRTAATTLLTTEQFGL